VTVSVPEPTADFRRPLRRRPVSTYSVIVLALIVIGFGYAMLAPSGSASSRAARDSASDIANGRSIYLEGCSSCHGLAGEGSKLAPSLIGVGGAAVDFQMGTGRMPLATRGPQAEKKPVLFTQQEINFVAAYIQSLGGGPNIPTNSDLDLSDTNLPLGGIAFRTSCAQCHNFAGKGGALTYGKGAPSMQDTSPRHIYEAMETGPENMPVFGDRNISPQEKRDIIRYITHIRAQSDPGGQGLGRVGPITEGLVGWLAGIGLLVVATVWIGARAK
jgi:ubiquinol-cytochrome c reductase cytochrome c subunit